MKTPIAPPKELLEEIEQLSERLDTVIGILKLKVTGFQAAGVYRTEFVKAEALETLAKLENNIKFLANDIERGERK